MIQTRNDLRHYLQEDLRANVGSTSRLALLKALLRGNGAANAYRFLRALRHTEYHLNNLSRSPLHHLPYRLWRLCYMHRARRYRLEIPLNCVGYGIRINHTIGGGIVMSTCTIGNYLDIRQFTTIGIKSDDRADERPVIGDHVCLGCHVSIIGHVHIGDHATIGAGSVVVKDIPPYAIAVGNPCRIIGTNSPSAH